MSWMQQYCFPVYALVQQHKRHMHLVHHLRHLGVRVPFHHAHPVASKLAIIGLVCLVTGTVLIGFKHQYDRADFAHIYNNTAPIDVPEPSSMILFVIPVVTAIVLRKRIC